MLLRWLLLTSFVAPLAIQETKSVVDAPTKAAICDVIHNPASYVTKRVLLEGIVEGQRVDHLILISPDCQFGILLKFTPRVSAHTDVQRLFRAIRRGNPGTTDRDISGQFTGRFVSDPDQQYALEVETIDGLENPKD